MNVNDYTVDNPPTDYDDIITTIFARQRELMDKYQQIEGLPTPPVSLHTPAGQRVIRDFAWRSTEELAEAYEAFLLKHDALDVSRNHALEELADSLHFLVELLIFAGIAPSQCYRECQFPRHIVGGPNLHETCWQYILQLGLAMNFLRNKAWKQSHVPTDELRFREALLEAFRAHLELWDWFGCAPTEMWTYYFRKARVNQFRQTSNY